MKLHVRISKFDESSSSELLSIDVRIPFSIFVKSGGLSPPVSAGSNKTDTETVVLFWSDASASGSN